MNGTTLNGRKGRAVERLVLAKLSHDLRGSLTAITLSVPQLLRTAEGRSAVRIIAERIDCAARSMIAAVEQLDEHRRAGMQQLSARCIRRLRAPCAWLDSGDELMIVTISPEEHTSSWRVHIVREPPNAAGYTARGEGGLIAPDHEALDRMLVARRVGHLHLVHADGKREIWTPSAAAEEVVEQWLDALLSQQMQRAE